jgi:Spy/CpxP family protein refolding chaperone
MRATRGALLLASAAFAAALAVTPASAQPPDGPRDPKAMAERQLEQLKTRLKLTADQEPKVLAVLEQNATRMRELRDKHNVQRGQPPSEEARKAMESARKENKDALAKILTPDQMTEFEKWQAERGPVRRRQPQ